MEDKILFEEKQQFRQWWLWLFIISLNGFIIYKIFIVEDYGNGLKSVIILPVVIMLSFIVFFYVLNLKTRIYKDKIEIKFYPFHKNWKKYPLQSIQKMEVIKYKPLLDYGGYGIRMGAYNVSGNRGLKIYYTDKNNYESSILIGTQKPEELSTIIKSIYNV